MHDEYLTKYKSIYIVALNACDVCTARLGSQQQICNCSK